MILNSYHTHTIFSDGHSTPEEVYNAALERNISQLAFSEHSPLPFDNPFSFKIENKLEYQNIIGNLKSKNPYKINVLMSLEMDYVPKISENFDYYRKDFNVDFLIGSVHLVSAPNGEIWFTDGPDYKIYDKGLIDYFDNDIKKAVKTYYYQVNEMIETQKFEIIGHFDKIVMHNKDRFFKEDEKWYKSLVNETIELIKNKNLIVEINSRGYYKKRSTSTFPSIEIIKILKNLQIPMVVTSDAHLSEELLYGHSFAYNLLKLANVKCVAYFKDDHWDLQDIDYDLVKNFK